jgi:predicted RNA binding protein YcfA (HicA-like mRNA interferase family)
MAEISSKDIRRAQRMASEKAVKLNKALGLEYYEVRNSHLILITPDGKETVIGTPRFGTRKIERKRFRLDDEQ